VFLSFILLLHFDLVLLNDRFDILLTLSFGFSLHLFKVALCLELGLLLSLVVLFANMVKKLVHAGSLRSDVVLGLLDLMICLYKLLLFFVKIFQVLLVKMSKLIKTVKNSLLTDSF